MTRFLRVRILGHDVRVAVRPGTAPGPPLVLCNGIGASLDLFQPFVDEVDPRIDVVRFDVPGVGGSPAPKAPYNFALLACFVGRLLDELGYDRFDALGISWGGGLAQQLAFQYPRRCRRLVLASTGTGMLILPARLRLLSKMLTPRRYRDPAYAKAIAPMLYGGRMRHWPDEARHVLYEQERLGPRTGGDGPGHVRTPWWAGALHVRRPPTRTATTRSAVGLGGPRVFSRPVSAPTPGPHHPQAADRHHRDSVDDGVDTPQCPSSTFVASKNDLLIGYPTPGRSGPIYVGRYVVFPSRAHPSKSSLGVYRRTRPSPGIRKRGSNGPAHRR